MAGKATWRPPRRAPWRLRKKNYLITSASCLLLFVVITKLSVCLADTEVTLEEVWGRLNMRADAEAKDITCTVYEPSPNGRIIWMIGDDEYPNNKPRETTVEGDWQQKFSLVPQISYDGKRFRCIYSLRDAGGAIEEEFEDAVELDITWSELPRELPVDAGAYYPGTPVELAAEFGLYPAPEGNDVVWEISDEEGNVLKLEPNQSDGPYKAGELKSDSENKNKYRASLFISNIDNDPQKEVKKSHVLVVTTKDSDQRIPVTFTLREESSDAAEDIVLPPETNPPAREDPPPAIEQTTVKPKSQATLSVGMFIIIAIVILIILICVGYCIYQRCFKDRHGSSTGGQGSFHGGSGRGGSNNRGTNYHEVPVKEGGKSGEV